MKKTFIITLVLTLVISFTYSSLAMEGMKVSVGLKGIDSLNLFNNSDYGAISGTAVMVEGKYPLKDGLSVGVSLSAAPNAITEGTYHEPGGRYHRYEMDTKVGEIQVDFISRGYEDGWLTLKPFIGYKVSNEGEKAVKYDGNSATADWENNTTTTTVFTGVKGSIPLTREMSLETDLALAPNVLRKTITNINGQETFAERSGMGGKVNLSVSYKVNHDISLVGGYEAMMIRYPDGEGRSASLGLGATWAF